MKLFLYKFSLNKFQRQKILSASMHLYAEVSNRGWLVGQQEVVPSIYNDNNFSVPATLQQSTGHAGRLWSARQILWKSVVLRNHQWQTNY